jgi:hypothetical protein
MLKLGANEGEIQKHDTKLTSTTSELGDTIAFYKTMKRGGILVLAIFCIILVTLLPLGIWLIVYYIQTKNNSFTLYESGFKVKDRHGEHQYLWKGVKETYYKAIIRYVNGIKTGTQYEFKMVFDDGAKAQVGSTLLGGNPEVESLGLTILDKTTQLLLPIYKQAFESGQQVHFGTSLMMDKEKLYYLGRWIQLSDIEQIDLDKGSVRIITKNNQKWANIKVYNIANLMVFSQLAKNFTYVNI